MVLNCKGRIVDLAQPLVMGILNTTPDSFFEKSRVQHQHALLSLAEQMLSEGASILDIGGVSTRPGAAIVSEKEELSRVVEAVAQIKQNFSDAIISVDTWRSSVAREAVAAGASIINDISGGDLDPTLFETVADLDVPYILMHIQGTPQTMQVNPVYNAVVEEVLDYFLLKINKLRSLGVKDIILDPGFGFGKTIAHNYTLLQHLDVFSTVTDLPVLAGLSRKSMICKPLHIPASEALNGTTALHIVALQKGAKILRVHDVRPAMETIRLFDLLQSSK